MTLRPRRYVFSSLEALVEGKIKKLAAICEKLFLFIDEEEPVVPVKIVQKLQRFGKKIKWVPVEIDLQSDFQVFFSFFVGKTHERTAPDVEFVILGANHQYDSLVRYLNTCGRSCLRLDPTRAFELLGPGYGTLEETEAPPVIIPGERERELPRMEEPSEAGASGGREKNDAISGKIAREVVERMIQSGNRPSEMPILREYIQLCHQGSLTKISVDSIIQHMQERKEIEVNGGLEVVYHF
ncbi:MAG: hypothetical protein IPL49_01645 [Saprospirales bacterium]|nr:hypothetical protein [Saprospirales bacterium]MBK8489623.1 hypothetical protein [Saprospirales bacterium]